MPLVPSPTVLSTDEMGRVAPPIAAAVGRDGTNNPVDVFVVQSLLDQRLPKPHSPVPINGTLDPGTILAIEAYQAVVMNMVPPTGRVDPGSDTYYSLAARPLVNKAEPSSQMGHFGVIPQTVIDAADASHLRWSIPVSITIAQWIVESAWGAAVPPGTNNPFGIKATGSQPGVDSPTREVVNGQEVTVTAKFRTFPSLSDAFDEHGRLLATGMAYKAAMREANDPNAFADALTGVYATDPQYGFTLKWVINNYSLNKYDR